METIYFTRRDGPDYVIEDPVSIKLVLLAIQRPVSWGNATALSVRFSDKVVCRGGHVKATRGGQTTGIISWANGQLTDTVLARFRWSSANPSGLVEAPPPATTHNILQEAEKIVNGPRASVYGSAAESFKKAAAIWSGILGVEITPEQVTMCMMGLKLSRLPATFDASSYDSLLDIAGFVACANDVVQARDGWAEGKPVE